MTKHKLPFDVARCGGNESSACKDCLRRLADRTGALRLAWMGAASYGDKCDYRIPVSQSND